MLRRKKYGRSYLSNLGAVAIFLWIAVAIGACAGWVKNILKIIEIVNDPITGMLVLRAIGVPFFPLGAVLGWF